MTPETDIHLPAIEGLLFYVGAVLIANGTYTYLQMIQVFNLVVFSVSIAGQLLSFGMFPWLCCSPSLTFH